MEDSRLVDDPAVCDSDRGRLVQYLGASYEFDNVGLFDRRAAPVPS